MAPEFGYKKYSNKVDIYSLGCIILELFILNNYFEDINIEDIIKEINPDIYDKKW